MTWKLDRTFEMTGKIYRTDAVTIETLRSVARSTEAVAAVMFLGLKVGRIVEVAA